jgi:hypothetical protein
MRKTFAFLSTVSAALSITPPGRKFAEVYFWDRVMHIMNPLIDSTSWVVVDYGPAVALLALSGYLFATDGQRAAFKVRVRRLNPYLVIAAFALVIFVGALLGAWLDYRRGPVNWVLDSPGSPIGFWQSADGPLLVSGFNVSGTNKTDKPVSFTDAYIQSGITNQIVRFRIGVPGGDITPAEATLEPHGSVVMVGNYPVPPEQAQQIQVSKLKEDFGTFKFYAAYADGRIFEKSFSADDVDALIAKAAKQHSDLLRRPAGIIRTR